MIQVTPNISLDEREISMEFIRASGPGGQNVNKVSTAVQLRFDAAHSPSLPEDVRERLVKLAGNLVTADGVLLIEAKRYRTQEQNRADAILRLSDLIYKAAQKPKVRRATRPSLSAKAARVFEKKRRGAIKKIRSYNPDEWE
jgi:ribosome-associated protein